MEIFSSSSTINLKIDFNNIQFCKQIINEILTKNKNQFTNEDIQWCKNTFTNDANVFLHYDDLIDFTLMQICDHNIYLIALSHGGQLG